MIYSGPGSYLSGYSGYDLKTRPCKIKTNFQSAVHKREAAKLSFYMEIHVNKDDFDTPFSHKFAYCKLYKYLCTKGQIRSRIRNDYSVPMRSRKFRIDPQY